MMSQYDVALSRCSGPCVDDSVLRSRCCLCEYVPTVTAYGGMLATVFMVCILVLFTIKTSMLMDAQPKEENVCQMK